MFWVRWRINKDVFLSCHERGTKTNSESPWGIEPQTFGVALRCCTIEPQRLFGERGLLRSSIETLPAYCLYHQSRLVCFECGEELRKMFFRLVTSVGQREILSHHKESSLRPSDLRSDAISRSHKDSSVSRDYYKVLMTRVLHTACITKVDWYVLSAVKN